MIEQAFRRRVESVLVDLQQRVVEMEMGSVASNNSVVVRGLRPLPEHRQ